MKKEAKIRYKVKTAEKKAVYLYALVPIVSAIVFVLSLNITDNVPLISDWGLYLIGNLEKFSVFGIVLISGYILLWGFIGSRFAKSGIGIVKALLIGNAVYILSALVFSGFLISGSAVETGYAIGGIGMGIFSILSGYLFFVVPIDFLEIYFSLIVALGVFTVGYSTSYKK